MRNEEEGVGPSQSCGDGAQPILPPGSEPAAAFTPGPWHIKPGDTPGFRTGAGGPGVYAPARLDDDFFILQIAALETNVKPREIVANARLIAAAPDQHAALAEIADGDRWHGETRFAEDTDADFLLRVIAAMQKTARNAIAKATGR